MPARRSWDASAISSPIRSVCLVGSPIVHGADVQDRDGAPALVLQVDPLYLPLGCAMSSPTPPTPDPSSSAHWRRSETGPWRSLSARTAARGFVLLPPTMGRRTHLRLARALPTARQGFREDHRKRRSLDHYRPHPPRLKASRKILLCRIEFRVGH